jgi:hypothetical protein
VKRLTTGSKVELLVVGKLVGDGKDKRWVGGAIWHAAWPFVIIAACQQHIGRGDREGG